MDRTQVKERRRTATHVARPAKVQEVEGLRQRLGQAAAAILTDFRGLNGREIAQLRAKLRQGGVEYKVLKTTRLADVPSRAQLLSSALGSMMSPLVGLVGVLTGLQRNLVYALDQIRQKRERAA